MKKVLFILRDSRYFVSHRLALAEALLAQGYAVTICCHRQDTESWNIIVKRGIAAVDTPLCFPEGKIRGFWSSACIISRSMKERRPEFVFTVTVAATLLGGLLCRTHRIRHIALIAGLGTIFRNNSFRFRMLRPLVSAIFRLALVKPKTQVVFQNEGDRQTFVQSRACRWDQTLLIAGSGVNTESFGYRPYPLRPNPIRRVGLVARMLRDKGVLEFAAAAQTLRTRWPEVEFHLVGGVDLFNPTSLTREQLQTLCKDSGVIWMGHRDDIPAVLSSIDIFCLPSYHEGLPKSMLEAASVGCALVVSDIPGCRAFVEHGVNGLLVTPRNSHELAEAIEDLLQKPNKAEALTQQARSRVEVSYSEKIIVKSYLELFQVFSSH